MTQYKRWYDYDPLLKEVLDLLKYYKEEFKGQAKVFLEKIEAQVGKEALDSFYETVKPVNGKRWYDEDPIVSKTVELLRIVPTEIQHKSAKSFMQALEDMGLDIDAIKSAEDK